MNLIKGDRQDAMGGHRTVIAIFGRALIVSAHPEIGKYG
jgi:hypothetical protein